uniref:Protease HtpX n=1 Tax=Candidatus Methanogaster sp. ANME-2c ERB4 TaxID=2759911 RepID=A0A7G9YAF6_9EURY|nr:protease HtpX [Methanosarcinales archaeon ANME-2c ERB4]QNO44990.1 protease HtpX [Methanosarcinales archaeon ANME-2c ERB4]QNO45068.1 protease HtpX [Methanosarcinales archaeon ANME-2c ERB4]
MTKNATHKFGINGKKAIFTGILAFFVAITSFVLILAPIIAVNRIFGIIVAAIFFIYCLATSSKLVYNERYEDLDKDNYPKVYEIVEELAMRAKIVMPSLYIIESGDINAMTCGFSPKSAKIIFTKSFLENLKLTDSELQAVIAHEMGHIVNKDYIIFTILHFVIEIMHFISRLTGRLSLWLFKSTAKTGKDVAGPLAIYSMISMLWSDDDDPFGSAATVAVVIFFVFFIFVVVLAIAFYIGLASLFLLLVAYTCTFFTNIFSRQREYAADEFSKELTGSPHPLSSALAKLEIWYERFVSAQHDWVHGNPNATLNNLPTMSIMESVDVSDVGADDYKYRKISFKSKFNEFFKMTHPLTEKRILSLEEPKTSKLEELFDKVDRFFNTKVFDDPNFALDAPSLVEHRNYYENYNIHSILFSIILALIFGIFPSGGLLAVMLTMVIGAVFGAYNTYIVFKNAFDTRISYLLYRVCIGGFIIGYVSSLILIFINPAHFGSFVILIPLVLVGSILGSIVSYYVIGMNKKEELLDPDYIDPSYRVLDTESKDDVSENIEKLMKFVYRHVVPVTDKLGGVINQFI